MLFARVPANARHLLSISWFLSTPWFAQFQLLFGQPGWGADTLGFKQEFKLNQVSRRCVAFADNEEPAVLRGLAFVRAGGKKQMIAAESSVAGNVGRAVLPG